MSWYGDYVTIAATYEDEEKKKNDIAKTAEQLIRSISTKDLNVKWNTLQLIIKEPGDGPLDPLNSFKEDDEAKSVPFMTVAIKVQAEEK